MTDVEQKYKMLILPLSRANSAGKPKSAIPTSPRTRLIFSPHSDKSKHSHRRGYSRSSSRNNRQRLHSARAYSPTKLNTAEGDLNNQFQALYSARCEDLNIPVLSSQFGRFLQICSKNFANRKFIVTDFGIGLKSA